MLTRTIVLSALSISLVGPVHAEAGGKKSTPNHNVGDPNGNGTQFC